RDRARPRTCLAASAYGVVICRCAPLAREHGFAGRTATFVVANAVLSDQRSVRAAHAAGKLHDGMIPLVHLSRLEARTDSARSAAPPLIVVLVTESERMMRKKMGKPVGAKPRGREDVHMRAEPAQVGAAGIVRTARCRFAIVNPERGK